MATQLTPPSIQSTGNCNFSYINHLRYWVNDPEGAMKHVLSQPNSGGYDMWGNKPKVEPPPYYRPPAGGMFLFAHGSDDDREKLPYARQFAEYIIEHKLGKLMETGPVPNPLHYNRAGVLYIWIVDHQACKLWWKEKVHKPYKARIAEAANSAKEKQLAAMAQQINKATDGI